MIYSAEADFVPFVKYLVLSLQPYAQANEVNLSFTSNCHRLQVQYQPFSISQPLTQLLCAVINLIPHQSDITVQLNFNPENGELLLLVENSGINLLYVNGSVMQSATAFTVEPLNKGTRFCLRLPFGQTTITTLSIEKKNDFHPLPQFYAELKKRLQSHFTQPEKMVAALAHSRPQEAAFLQKINALIKANLEDETFDTASLCKSMSMSRTQLFRRLKPLIRQAPALYIKTMRLQRAKELLETRDMTVSEVAFQTGFQNGSHFTKVFQKQFGVLPSVFRRSNKPATNE